MMGAAATLALRHLNRRKSHLRLPWSVGSGGANPNHESSYCFTRRSSSAVCPFANIREKMRSLSPEIKQNLRASDPEAANSNLKPKQVARSKWMPLVFQPEKCPPIFEGKPSERETEARDLFESWCRKYNKTYSSKQQKLNRFTIFKENLQSLAARDLGEDYVTIRADQAPGEEWGPSDGSDPDPDPDDRLSYVKMNNRNRDPDGYFFSETEARELFEIWCKKYGRSYPTEEEKVYRFTVFRGRIEWRTRQSQIGDPRSFGANVFADLTMDEVKELHGKLWRPLRDY